MESQSESERRSGSGTWPGPGACASGVRSFLPRIGIEHRTRRRRLCSGPGSPERVMWRLARPAAKTGVPARALPGTREHGPRQFAGRLWCGFPRRRASDGRVPQRARLALILARRLVAGASPWPMGLRAQCVCGLGVIPGRRPGCRHRNCPRERSRPTRLDRPSHQSDRDQHPARRRNPAGHRPRAAPAASAAVQTPA